LKNQFLQVFLLFNRHKVSNNIFNNVRLILLSGSMTGLNNNGQVQTRQVSSLLMTVKLVITLNLTIYEQDIMIVREGLS